VWGFLASLSAVALSLYHPGMPSDVRAEDWKPTPREPEQGSDPRYPTGARDQDRWPWRSDRTADLSRNPDPKIRLAANEGSEGGPKQSFDIPAGNLETALIGFSRQSGIQLLYASDLVAGHETTGLRGDYVPEDALRLLLDKTGLQYRFSNPNAVTVQPAGRSEDVGPPTPATPQAETKPVKVPEIVVKEKKERALVVDQPDGYKADVSSEAVLRFPARIQELPMSVGVVTQDSMRERRAVTQTEALEGIAGISKTGQFSGPTADSYVIRGFTTDTEFPGYTRDNGLSAFNNYVGDPTLYERIEVIKGAASFTSGLVTAGGFVNRLLKAPEYRNFVAGEAGVGSHGHYRTTLDANGVMPNLPVAGRFVFSHNEDPEFFRNTGNQRFSFLPSVRFSPREDFTVTVTGNVQRLRGKGNFGTPTTTQGLIPAGIEDSFQGNDNRVKIDYHSLHIEADKKFVQGLRLKAKGQYSHSDSRYQYAYGYQRTDSLGGIGADGNFSIYGNAGHFKRESFAGEVNLTREFSLFGNPSSVAAGVDYSTSRRGFRLAEALDFGTGNIANPQINAPFPAGFIIDSPTSLSGTIRYSDIRYNQTGAFLQGLLRPFAGTTLMIALRGNWITQGSLEEEGTPFPEGPGNREGLNASRLTPQVGLSQRLTQGLNVYASYGESIQPNFALTRDGSLLEPITGRTVEIGSKWELLEKRLRFTAALFRTDLSNVATPDPADPIRFSIGGQSQRNQGFEFQAQGAPLPQLQVNLAYTFLEAEITKSTIPDVIGARPQNVPAHTVSVFGSYDFSELVTKGLKLGAVVLYRSEVHAFVPLQSEIFSGYTRADLFAIYAPLKWLSFQVNLNNIADARYIEGPISYGAYNTFGAPRHVIGMVRMTF
jgi:iron complex outermembrane receptor protein